jgi:hypothetical protein
MDTLKKKKKKRKKKKEMETFFFLIKSVHVALIKIYVTGLAFGN